MSIQANFPAIKPTLLLDFANTEALDPRITFTRASTGTYYDGKAVAKAEENLLTFSEQFDNAAWSKGSSTITVNSVTAPDGTTTADSVIETATTAVHYLYQGSLVSGSTYAFSVYLKANTRNWAWIYNWSAADRRASFDLQNGVVGTVVGGTASIVSVGSGWYRCTFVSSVAGTGASGFGPANADNTYSYAGDGTSGIYAWGAQLEQRASATAYTPTTTQPVTNYIPVLLTAASGVPRFEHNPVTGESLGLLIEEQRTNLVTYSEGFDTAAWSKTSVSVLANAAVSPDGTLDADKILETTANSDHAIHQQQTLAWASGSKVCFSVYLKAGERRYAKLLAGGATAGWNAYCAFDLQTGVAGTPTGNSATATASMTDVGNGWYRCVIVATPAVSSTTAAVAYIHINNSINANDGSYTGNGFSGIYAWGAQLEAGAFATSYIPTVASQVTRAADSASMTGTNFSSWYNPSEGAVYCEASPQLTGLRGLWGIGSGTSTNSIYATRAASEVICFGTANASTQWNLSSTVSTNPIKTAIAFANNNVAFTVNGGSLINDPTAVVPQQTMDILEIGRFWSNPGYSANGTIKKLAYYPRRLTNTQIQSLTS